jgi:uncharacterized membrane protein HdeD (DUF308 family)
MATHARETRPAPAAKPVEGGGSTGAARGGWQAATAHERGWWALAGLLSSLWGALLLIVPVPGAAVATLALGAYALGFGIFLLAAVWRSGEEALPR